MILGYSLTLQSPGTVVVSPTFAGDTLTALERFSDVITALTHEAWLVAHQDARHSPPIRAAIETITALFPQG